MPSVDALCTTFVYGTPSARPDATEPPSRWSLLKVSQSSPVPALHSANAKSRKADDASDGIRRQVQVTVPLRGSCAEGSVRMPCTNTSVVGRSDAPGECMPL